MSMTDNERTIASQMGNVLYNLAQKAGRSLTTEDAAMFDALRKQWDEACRTPAAPVVAEGLRELLERVADRLSRAQIFPLAAELRAALAAHPTDAKPDDDLFEEMVEEGYTALAEHSDEWRGDPEASPASGRESFAVALRAALAVRTTAAQSVRDAALAAPVFKERRRFEERG